MLGSPLITAFAAQNTLYVLHEPRIDFFGLVYIYIYAAVILLRFAPHSVKNFTFLLLLLLAFYNIHTTAYAAKVWQLGFKAETNLAERIISRIENTPIFNPQQKYAFVQGGTLDFRSRYYLPDNRSKTDSYTQTAPLYTVASSIKSIQNFLFTLTTFSPLILIYSGPLLTPENLHLNSLTSKNTFAIMQNLGLTQAPFISIATPSS